jgi:hypothetical protein
MSSAFSSLRIALSLGVLMLGQGLVQATAMNAVGPGNGVTVGTFDSGNCLPFMCNVSNTNVGQSIDFQQVYSRSAFSGMSTIDSITWYFDANVNNVGIALGGTYEFEWGYAALNSVNNLSSTLANNYISGPNVIGTATIPAGGESDNPTLTLSGFTPFTYNPALGNLLLEIIVTNQDNVGNDGIHNGYNEADSTGTVTSRAFCTANGCSADAVGLVTTFDVVNSSVPEPGTLVLLGSGLLAFGMMRIRRSKA